MRIFFKGFNFSQDGPGNRLVYHLQGCNMKCPWCSNPEGMELCGGKEYSVSELLSECIRSRAMFFSGGGVTFTGGEATLQHEELSELLTLLRKNGIHTAIETNATSPRLSELLPQVDFFIMDFKHPSTEVQRRVCGVGNGRICANYEYAVKSGREVHVRIPLIHGFNDDCPEEFARYLSSVDTKKVTVELLPYHEYGREKWKTEYTVTDGFVPVETVRLYKDTLEKHGLKVIKT